MMLSYGYLKDTNGEIRTDEEKGRTVRLSYNLYLERIEINHKEIILIPKLEHLFDIRL